MHIAVENFETTFHEPPLSADRYLIGTAIPGSVSTRVMHISFAASTLSGNLRHHVDKSGEDNGFKEQFPLAVCQHLPLPADERHGELCATEIRGNIDNGLSGSRLRMLFSVGRAPAIEWFYNRKEERHRQTTRRRQNKIQRTGETLFVSYRSGSKLCY
jgi:hypothetical protein